MPEHEQINDDLNLDLDPDNLETIPGTYNSFPVPKAASSQTNAPAAASQNITDSIPETPVGLTLDEVLPPLELLFRDSGSTTVKAKRDYIVFCHKNDEGKFRNIRSLTLNEFKDKFDELEPKLRYDAYFSVNSMYAPFGKNKTTSKMGILRDEGSLCHLNGCYADLDFGRDEGTPAQCLTWEEVKPKWYMLFEQNRLPWVSMLCRSGRGMYAFWKLHDEKDPTQPQRAYSEKIELYKAIQRRIVEVLEPLAADKSGVDAARILRLPGTIHRISHKRATYVIQVATYRNKR